MTLCIDRQIGSIQVRSVRCSNVFDLDRTPLQAVADEVADGVMNIEGQIGSNKGKAAGDLGLDAVQFLVQRKVLNTTSSTRLFSPPLILVSVHPS